MRMTGPCHFKICITMSSFSPIGSNFGHFLRLGVVSKALNSDRLLIVFGTLVHMDLSIVFLSIIYSFENPIILTGVAVFAIEFSCNGCKIRIRYGLLRLLP